jgi:hypothetical protein
MARGMRLKFIIVNGMTEYEFCSRTTFANFVNAQILLEDDAQLVYGSFASS